MKTKEMKRLKPPQAPLKYWAQLNAHGTDDLAKACRTWIARKGLMLLLALLAFPLLGAPSCGATQQQCAPGAWAHGILHEGGPLEVVAMCGRLVVRGVPVSGVLDYVDGVTPCPDTHVEVQAQVSEGDTPLECTDTSSKFCIPKEYWNGSECAFPEDALPEIPWQGCDEPRILAPGPAENGNWISLRRGHADRFVSTIWIDHRNWMVGTPPRTIASCGPHELVITVFRAGNLVSPAETIVITDPAWNLLEIPISRLSGEIWVNVEFRYEVATATHTCIGVCGDTQVTQRGDFFWCRPEPGSSLPSCYDMVDGGDTPQPGFVAYAPMIWTDACYSSRTC